MQEQIENLDDILTEAQVQTLLEYVDQEINAFLQEDVSNPEPNETLDRLYERFFENRLAPLLKKVKVAITKNRIDTLTFAEGEEENRRIRDALKQNATYIVENRLYLLSPYQQIINEQNLTSIDHNAIENAYKQLFRNKKLFGEDQKARIFLLSIPQAIEEFNETFEDEKRRHVESWMDEIGTKHQGGEVVEEDVGREIDEDYIEKAQGVFNANIDKAKSDFINLFTLIPQEALPERVAGDELETESMKVCLAEKTYNKEVGEVPYHDTYNQILISSKKLATEEEKKENILLNWQKFIDVYNQLDAQNDQTIVAFMNAFLEFNDKLNALGRSIGEDTSLLFKVFNDYLVATGNGLDFDEDKANIINRILALVDAAVSGRQKDSAQRDIATKLIQQQDNFPLPATNAASTHLLKTIIYGNLSKFTLLKNFGQLAYTDPLQHDKIHTNLNIPQNPNKFNLLVDYLKQQPEVIKKLTKHKDVIVGQSQQTSLEKAYIKDKTLNKELSAEFSNSALDRLNKMKADLTQPGHRPGLLEQQAAFKHRVSEAKYTISEQETRLLSSITSIPVTRLVFKKKVEITYPGDVLSYQEFIGKLNNEIERRNQVLQTLNSKWYSSLIPFKKRLNKLTTYELEQAKAIVEYYQEQRENTKNPQHRLQQGQRRAEKAPEDKGNAIRNRLLKLANGLSSLFKKNRQLKQLNQIINNKTVLAREIKHKGAPLLRKEAKAEREHEVAKHLSDEGQLGHNFALESSGKDKDRSLFKKYTADKEIQDLMGHLDKVNNQLDMICQKLSEAQNAAKEAQVEDTIPRYKTKDIPLLDPEITPELSELEKEIKERMLRAEIMPQSEQEHKEKINNLDIARMLAERERTILLKEKIGKLPISKFSEALKVKLETDFRNIIATFKSYDIQSITDQDTLMKIGSKLSEIKIAKRNYKREILTYNFALDMEVLAKQEVSEFLRSLSQKSTEEIKSDIKKWAKQLTKSSDEVSHDVSTFERDRMVAAKLIQMANDLRDVATKLTADGNGDGNNYAVLLEEYEAQLKKVTAKNMLQKQCANELLRAANDALASSKYMADHVTDSLGPPRS